MGSRAALAMLCDQVARVIPQSTPHERFLCHSNGTRNVEPLEQIRSPSQDRLFDVIPTGLPKDDGEAAVSDFRLTTGFAIRVLYRRAGDLTSLERKIVEDASSIVRRVLDPNRWSAAANGIDCIDLAGDPIAKPNGGTVMVSLPFALRYHDPADDED